MREADFHGAIAGREMPPPHLRFGVYRNNVAAALINALRVRYPVTAKLLGPQAFAALAGGFALSHLPSSAVLIDYGAAFPQTLEPPLADVARLESLWWSAYHAAEAEPMDPSILTAVPPEALAAARFTLHPSLGLMTSEFNVGAVWEAARSGAAVDFATAEQCLLVARPEAVVTVTALPRPSYDFIAALAAGDTLAEALEGCAQTHAGFDFTTEIAGLLSHRIIIGV